MKVKKIQKKPGIKSFKWPIKDQRIKRESEKLNNWSLGKRKAQVGRSLANSKWNPQGWFQDSGIGMTSEASNAALWKF